MRRSPAPAQCDLDFRSRGHRRGGKRAGAGRPKTGRRVGVVHRTRPLHRTRDPLHVTIRVVASFPHLRRRDLHRCVAYAMAITLRRHDFRICHVSIQGNHIHLLVEADDRVALSRGMQGFQISCAKQMNRTLARRGRVFADRYHAEPLRNPTQTRNALAYVLNNWRKHRGHRANTIRHDPFSTAILFPGWTDAPPVIVPGPSMLLLPIARPTTWLLRVGWQRASSSLLSPFAAPSPR